MEKKEYLSPQMDVVLLEDSRVFLAVSIDSGSDEGGIEDWE